MSSRPYRLAGLLSLTVALFVLGAGKPANTLPAKVTSERMSVLGENTLHPKSLGEQIQQGTVKLSSSLAPLSGYRKYCRARDTRAILQVRLHAVLLIL